MSDEAVSDLHAHADAVQPTRNEPHAFVGVGDDPCAYNGCGRHRTAVLHDLHDATRQHEQPWWKGRCREIAEAVNLGACHSSEEVTAFQVEQVLLRAEEIRRG